MKRLLPVLLVALLASCIDNSFTYPPPGSRPELVAGAYWDTNDSKKLRCGGVPVTIASRVGIQDLAQAADGSLTARVRVTTTTRDWIDDEFIATLAPTFNRGFWEFTGNLYQGDARVGTAILYDEGIAEKNTAEVTIIGYLSGPYDSPCVSNAEFGFTGQATQPLLGELEDDEVRFTFPSQIDGWLASQEGVITGWSAFSYYFGYNVEFLATRTAIDGVGQYVLKLGDPEPLRNHDVCGVPFVGEKIDTFTVYSNATGERTYFRRLSHLNLGQYAEFHYTPEAVTVDTNTCKIFYEPGWNVFIRNYDAGVSYSIPLEDAGLFRVPWTE